MKIFRWFLVLIFISDISLAENTESYSVNKKNGYPWRVAYFEGGPYSDYNKVLIGTIKGLVELGWLDNKPLPDFSAADSKAIWSWISENLSNQRINFDESRYYTAGWDEKKRELIESEMINRSNSNEFDLIFAMGTWAGQSLASDLHDTPTLVMSANSTTKCTTLYLSSPAHFFKHYGWLLEPKTLSWS